MPYYFNSAHYKHVQSDSCKQFSFALALSLYERMPNMSITLDLGIILAWLSIPIPHTELNKFKPRKLSKLENHYAIQQFCDWHGIQYPSQLLDFWLTNVKPLLKDSNDDPSRSPA